MLAALLLAASVAHAAAAPNPLAVLMKQLAAPADETPGDKDQRLARIEANLIADAADFEALGESSSKADKAAAAARMDPALKPFVKNRDASLNAIYRTLAVLDYTRELRMPRPACDAQNKRSSLLRGADGLFVDPDVGSLSPWMSRLLGPSSFGDTPEQALDQAAAPTRLTPAGYEKARARAAALTAKLAGASLGEEARSGLYCERADLYERLARARSSAAAPIPL